MDGLLISLNTKKIGFLFYSELELIATDTLLFICFFFAFFFLVSFFFLSRA